MIKDEALDTEDMVGCVEADVEDVLVVNELKATYDAKGHKRSSKVKI